MFRPAGIRFDRPIDYRQVFEVLDKAMIKFQSPNRFLIAKRILYKIRKHSAAVRPAEPELSYH